MIPYRSRRVVAALALVGLFIATYLLLYKLGALGELVCGVAGGCETVQASPYAYFLGLPVAAWGIAGYLAILAAAIAGTQPALGDRRWLSIAILALTGIGFAFSLYLSALEAWVIRAWCRWCIVSAVIATLAFVFALPEIRWLSRRASPG